MKGIAILACVAVASFAGYETYRQGDASVRVNKMAVIKDQSRLAEFTCPDGQQVVWTSVREIGCEG